MHRHARAASGRLCQGWHLSGACGQTVYHLRGFTRFLLGPGEGVGGRLASLFGFLLFLVGSSKCLAGLLQLLLGSGDLQPSLVVAVTCPLQERFCVRSFSLRLAQPVRGCFVCLSGLGELLFALAASDGWGLLCWRPDRWRRRRRRCVGPGAGCGTGRSRAG